jgi:large subunit ribosomal protein L25
VHLSSIALPKNTTVRTHEKDLTIATIAAPSGLRSEEAAAASAEPAAAEPAKK